MTSEWRFRLAVSAPSVRRLEAQGASALQGPGPTVTVALALMPLIVSVILRV
jgi:hypothetical protein